MSVKPFRLVIMVRPFQQGQLIQARTGKKAMMARGLSRGRGIHTSAVAKI
jgi:hypothetical protein